MLSSFGFRINSGGDQKGRTKTRSYKVRVYGITCHLKSMETTHEIPNPTSNIKTLVAGDMISVFLGSTLLYAEASELSIASMIPIQGLALTIALIAIFIAVLRLVWSLSMSRRPRYMIAYGQQYMISLYYSLGLWAMLSLAQRIFHGGEHGLYPYLVSI